ncbi:hypothetical protein [Streptomyces glaucosporus]|uniref:hypothetical protein n=1 Tax=Streptomyces glaucosporus TaxID=284044 RepID=UPI003CD08916
MEAAIAAGTVVQPPAGTQRRGDALVIGIAEEVGGVSDGTVPMKSAVTPAEVDAPQHQRGTSSELSLLFVACTRAREALRVSWHGTPSPFLAPVTGRSPS